MLERNLLLGSLKAFSQGAKAQVSIEGKDYV
jgi:hypothetical protein